MIVQAHLERPDMSLRKLCAWFGVSLYHYLADRLSCANRLPSLASLITARHQQSNLNASCSFPEQPPLFSQKRPGGSTIGL